MNANLMKIFAISAMLLAGACAFAQAPQLDEKALKEFREKLDQTVEDMEITFDLEDWQTFYVDSIFTYNFTQRRDELLELQSKKVTVEDAYARIDDKWMEATYQALHKVFNEKQWAKYLKTGAAKDKKARDKRAEKRNQQ